MILLLGSSHDDILYFETVIRNKVECAPLYKKFPMIQGTIFNQNVTIVYGLFTSYLSGAVISGLLHDISPLLVILLGRCKLLSGDMKHGDIAISKHIVGMDIDQSEYQNVKVGQIPGFDSEYLTSLDAIQILTKTMDRSLINNYRTCTYMCSNKIINGSNSLEEYGKAGFILGHSGNIVLDSESYGTALACSLYNVPLISIKAVDSTVENKSTINDYVRTLKTYSNIGKAVVSFIGEIGRRDLVE